MIQSLGMFVSHGSRYAGRGAAEWALLLVGFAFAGLIVWAIQSSGRRTV
jgi:hypothetical protein